MIRSILSCAVCVGILFAPAVSAQSNSTVEQQIIPNSCNYTTVATGMGVVHDSTCPVFAPTIESVSSNRGRPVIRGIYDAVHASVFRVRVAGMWYTLGTNSELTADGNVWMLDLSTLNQPLAEGTYAIMVEMQATDGSLLQTGGSVVVDGSEPTKNNGGTVDTPPKGVTGGKGNEEKPLPVDDKQPQPAEERAEPGYSIPIIVIIALLGAGGFFLGLVRRRIEPARDE